MGRLKVETWRQRYWAAVEEVDRLRAELARADKKMMRVFSQWREAQEREREAQEGKGDE